MLKEGTDCQDNGPDIDALVAYLGKVGTEKKPFAPPRKLARIEGSSCK